MHLKQSEILLKLGEHLRGFNIELFTEQEFAEVIADFMIQENLKFAPCTITILKDKA